MAHSDAESFAAVDRQDLCTALKARRRYPAARDFDAKPLTTSANLRARGEEAVGELAQALLENPLFSSALGKALGAGERAVSAQRSAMGALNVASGSDVERLEQRLRSLSGRLEAIEDRLDEVADRLAVLSRRRQRRPAGLDRSEQARGLRIRA